MATPAATITIQRSSASGAERAAIRELSTMRARFTSEDLKNGPIFLRIKSLNIRRARMPSRLRTRAAAGPHAAAREFKLGCCQQAARTQLRDAGHHRASRYC